MTQQDDRDGCRQATEKAAQAIVADLSDEPGRPRDDVHFDIKAEGTGFLLYFAVGTSWLSVPIDCKFAVDWRLIAFQFAGLLQDAVVEESGDPLPLCPDHVDLLVPDFVDHVPMWVCSRGEWRAPFGEYWATARRSS